MNKLDDYFKRENLSTEVKPIQRRRRCGKCANCLQKECGQCKTCEDKNRRTWKIKANAVTCNSQNNLTGMKIVRVESSDKSQKIIIICDLSFNLIML